MLRSDELKVKLNEVKSKVDKCEKLEEVNALMEEVKVFQMKIELALADEAEEAATIAAQIQNNAGNIIDVNNELGSKKKVKENANYMRACIKKTMGKGLTEAENSLLVGGAVGEGYILPQEIITIITKLQRQYKSIAEILGHIPVTALTGSFPVENFETVTALVDFVDGTPIGDISDIAFKNVSFSLKEKAGFISLSNTLLNMTDNDLIAYVAEVFARKLVVTQNTIGFATLKAGKTVKALTDWKGLKKSINVDLSEAVKGNMHIVTNQDGFDYLDSALDGYGRPVLQPNPANPTARLFMGYPVSVFDNALLPTTGSTAGSIKAPLYYGDLSDAVKFCDLGQYEFAADKSVGFLTNVTVARIITHLDCVQVDSSDKAYVAATLLVG